MGHRTNSGCRTAWIAAALLALPIAPATAEDINLQGVWQYSRVNTRGDNYSGNISIDGHSQASDVTRTPLGTVAQTGYVKRGSGLIEIVFTKAVRNGPPYNPDHFSCTIQSEQAMSCSNVDSVGSSSYTFALVRVGQAQRR